MPCIGITLRLDAALAEAFGEALLDCGAQSVSLENLDAERQTVDALLHAEANVEQLVRRASDACRLNVAPGYTVRLVADEDWVGKAQAQFEPLELGERLWIGPSWRTPPSGRLAVRLDPGLAFGTGSHPTTRLVLRYLERTILGGEQLLDYGCGSGILAIVAAKLGAARVDAADIDPQAVQVTMRNARANDVALRAALPEELPAATYDVIVSNILAQPLIVLAPLLASVSTVQGRLALAGILETQADEVADAYAPWFDVRVSSWEDGWALVEGVRK